MLPAPPAPARRRPGRGLGWAIGVMVLAMALPTEAGQSTSAKAFQAFEGAWRAGNATGIANLQEPRGRLRVGLLAPQRINGSWTKAQTVSNLKKYFGARGTSQRTLKVVPQTPANPKVRLYDYTYRPYGGDPTTTRLRVTLKQQTDRTWVLASIAESPRPR